MKYCLLLLLAQDYDPKIYGKSRQPNFFNGQLQGKLSVGFSLPRPQTYLDDVSLKEKYHRDIVS